MLNWLLIFAFGFLSLQAGAHSAPALVNVPSGRLNPFWIAPKTEKNEIKPAALEIAGFAARVYQVTNQEFLEFVRKHEEWRKSKIPAIFAEKTYLTQFAGDLTLAKGIRPDAPANYVSWFAARAFCESLGLRLPTLQEWEYMAAANEAKADASSDPDFLSKILEWYGEPKPAEGLKSVGQRKANFYGVHDLHGLVWEWVDDFNSSLVSGESRADSELNRNLFCGGGAMGGGNKENYAAFMRFAFRSSLKGNTSLWNLGFRCVKSLGAKP